MRNERFYRRRGLLYGMTLAVNGKGQIGSNGTVTSMFADFVKIIMDGN